jgi:dihydroorotase
MLHRDFPDLKIILEHCTTEKAIEAVKSYGPTVVGTITAHHLSLTVDDWAGDSFNYCKPVAKTPRDRIALLKAAASGSPKFFFGSDSAPHSIQAKQGSLNPPAKQAAGVYTQPFCTQLVLDAFEQGCQEGLLNEDQLTHKVLSGFLGEHGRLFYHQPMSNRQIILGAREIVQIPDLIAVDNRTVAIAPFRRGQRTRSLGWL